MTRFSLASLICLCMLTVGVGNVWGAVYSLTPDKTSTGSSSTTYITTLTEFTYANPTGSSITWKMNQWNPSNMQIKTNQSSATSEFRFYNSSAFAGKITKVVMTFSALTLSNTTTTGFQFLGGSSAVTSTSGGADGTWNSTAKTITWTPATSTNYTYFAFYQNGKKATGTNKLATSNAIVIYYLTKVALDKNGGTKDGVAYFDDNATAASTATGYTFSAATRSGSYACKGYYTAASGGTKVLNADGTFASATVSGYITSGEWTYAGGTLKLYAQWESAGTSVSLTKAGETNGTISLSPASSVTTTGAAGAVTVTATPEAGYYLSNLTATNPATGTASVTGSGNTRTVTYSSGANGSSTITATFSPIWQLRGDFNSWGATDPLTTYSAGVATVTKTLDAMTKYEFKMYNAQEAAYYKNIGKIITDISGWGYTSGDGANTFLYTGPAGTYTFKFTLEGKLLQVQYPEVVHPAAGYAYFQKQDSWTGFKAYIYTSDDNRMSDWDGSPAVTNTTNICGTTYYYCALTTDFNNVIFRDNGSNQWKAITTTGYSGKYCGDDYSASPQTWKTFGTYSLNFAGNGNTSGSMTNLTGQCPNSNIVLAANAFAKTDHTFTGWIANVNVKNSSGTTITAGTLITNESTIQITQNTILTAQWTHNPELTVSKSSIAFGSKKVDGSYTETFTVSGSYLKGNIGIAVSGTNNAMFTVSSSTLTPSDGSVATTTITVTYSPTTAASHSATITISSTGVSNKTISLTGTGQYQDTYIDNIWNQSVAVQTGSYTRPSISDQDDNDQTDCQHLHYHFVGWITKAKYDAGTTIDAGDIQATGSVNASNATFYAVWAKADAGGGEEAYNKVTSTEGITSDGRYLIVYDTDGAVFNGNLSSLDAGENVVSATCSDGVIAVTDDNRTTLANAEFTIDITNKYIVSHSGKYINQASYANGLSSNDDATEVHSISINGSENFVVEGTGVSGSSYVSLRFNSTTGSSNYRFRFYKTGQQAIQLYKYDAGVTYTDYIASCGAEYNITLDKNGGTTDGSAVVTANATTLSNLVAPTWTGHDVDYYMVASADNSTKIAEANGALAAGVTSGTPWTDSNGKWVKGGDATIYAKWKYAEYEIAYYDQGGSAFSGVHGDGYPTTHTYNTATTLVNPTKNGYNFAGWYTASDCSTGLVTSLGATAYTSGPINLYAKWTLKTYDVTWVVNGTTVATQTSVTYGTTYEDLSSTPSNPADNALADCGSDKFIGWVTAEYTAEGGTKALQYDPYAVTNSTTIDDTHHTFYAMFAKESGTAFTLDGANGSTQELLIYATVNGDNYYATGDVNGSGKLERLRPDDVGTPGTYVFTKTGTGTYSIKLKGSSKYIAYDTKTDLAKVNDPYIWTISASNHGSWRVASGTSGRALIYSHSIAFGGYATSNITSTPASYWDLELGTSNLTNYRTGCCSETITLTVSDATSGAGGTVAMKWNNASKSSGAEVSTCSTGTLVVDVTANPSYTLTAITIAGTNKTITIDPADLTTGLPSTSKMTYTVTVPSLATGTLTITPTFTRTYSVTYNLDGGETAGSTAVVNYQSGATVTLVTPDPTRSGYNFTGWTVTKDGGGNVSVSAGKFTMPTDNVTATAGWAAKTLSSISVAPTTAEVYVGQYVQIPVTYDPADILTKGYTLVSTPGYCVTTGSTNTTLKITGGRGGVTITSTQVETVSIKATADNTKTASVTVTVKPLPVDHFVDLVHGETFADQAASIVDNNLSTAYTAPGHADVDAPLEGNDCEKQHLHLVGWIESEWANAHLTATMSEITSAEDNEHNPLFFEVYAPMNVSGRTYYAVWGKEVTP